ncbi:MAG: RNA helicase [Azospira oryzae]|nr:MAG: RNA helicase [Azospira oryzae]PZP81031.1 MAG: RNA helicase [Azospira oryzae]
MPQQADLRRIFLSQSFARLGLQDELIRAVEEQGYAEPTPIQTRAIPVILEGHDVLAAAQTGTGKTAGFTLPLLQRLAPAANTSASPARHPVRALILTPTRELAAQVEESVRGYGKYLPLRSTLAYGGVSMNPQIEALRLGVDILVATPGRLLDHVRQRTVNLSQVKILVLDEADRMLDMGFIRDIRRLLTLLPPRRQNLLFSATFTDGIRKLAGGLLHAPVLIEVAARNAASERVAQRVYPVGAEHKRALLAHLVASGNWHQVLVFTKTKHGANRLAQQLCKDGIQADAIHGNKSQSQRMRVLQGFKDGQIRVLVATDLAARGLDIEALPHVVNYDLPLVAEDYVHRIGRTGRAGCSGEAISLVAPEEQRLLAAIEKLLNRRLERHGVPNFEPGKRALSEPLAHGARSEARGRGGESAHREARPHTGLRIDDRSRPQARSRGNAHAPTRVVSETPSSAHVHAEAGPMDASAPTAPARRRGGRRGAARPMPALLSATPRGAA